eukprot:4816263-Alexandrium_andersonii.AAC.1
MGFAVCRSTRSKDATARSASAGHPGRGTGRTSTAGGGAHGAAPALPWEGSGTTSGASVCAGT